MNVKFRKRIEISTRRKSVLDFLSSALSSALIGRWTLLPGGATEVLTGSETLQPAHLGGSKSMLHMRPV